MYGWMNFGSTSTNAQPQKFIPISTILKNQDIKIVHIYDVKHHIYYLNTL